ncbi:MAG: tetratricopeptide repeat protein, partial [Muribaculaceae bacterium]|nr:tetratricopeptide repeat protein [Muribaculaceae bacterium]
MKENSSSAVAKYNLGLSEVRLGVNPADTSQTAKNMKKDGISQLQQVAKMAKEKPSLASRANYNLGNVSFIDEDYSSALNYYKEALRINPEDDDARRNLRITQLKLQNQDNQDNNQDQNQDQQEEKEDNKDNQDNKQDQNQDEQDNQQNQSPQQQDINSQTAEQILNAIENKENQTR